MVQHLYNTCGATRYIKAGSHLSRLSRGLFFKSTTMLTWSVSSNTNGATMRNLETIDSELRLLAAVRWSIREHGGEPSSRQVDELLDERGELTRS